MGSTVLRYILHYDPHTQDIFFAITGIKGRSMKTMLRDLDLELEGI